MSAPVGVVMARGAALAAARKEKTLAKRRARRQILREAYPTVSEMVAESKHRPGDPLTALVCLLAELPNHLYKAEPTASLPLASAAGSDSEGV